MSKPYDKDEKKYCKYCERDITKTNFSEHKKTKKHIMNVKNYKQPNLLETNEDSSSVKYIKLELQEMRNNIDKLLNNLNN